jgi:hypothetical protein
MSFTIWSVQDHTEGLRLAVDLGEAAIAALCVTPWTKLHRQL